MKFRHGAAAAAMAASGAYAQAPPAYTGPATSSASSTGASISAAPAASDLPVSYTTVTYDYCESSSLETMITVTNGITVTYCPECEASASATPTSKLPGHVTTYTTTYLSLCPTGTVPVTYTVTESCDEPEPTWTPGPSHIPQGYTVTVKDCTVCHSDLDKTSTIPVTITEPCDCDANEGTTVIPTKKPAPATTTPATGGNPVQQISDGQIQNPTGKPVQQISDGQIQNPTGAAPSKAPTTGNPAPTGSAGGSAPPAYSTTPAGPGRPAESSGKDIPGVDYGNTTNVTPAPYEGAAASSTTAGVAMIMMVAVFVGGFAFAL